jgi:hypothetical protein
MEASLRHVARLQDNEFHGSGYRVEVASLNSAPLF